MTTLLVSAHPGHELRLHHWMEQVRPDVYILTDGSGSKGVARLVSSLHVIERAGARLLPGSGAISDRRIYEAMLRGDQEFFNRLRSQLAGLIRRAGYAEIVCDGLEGFNTTHDWCHYLVLSLARPLGVRVFEHSLADAPGAWTGPGSRCLSLDEDAIHRKFKAAEGNAELAAEVEASLGRWGGRAFAAEILRPVTPADRPPRSPGTPPHYEVFGERRVREGAYLEVIRWETHIRPLVDRLWNMPVEP